MALDGGVISKGNKSGEKCVSVSDLRKKHLNKTKVVEKVEYRGNFRVVGVVYNGNKKVGYGIIDVKNYSLKLFTEVQTIELLKRYKFENAELNGKDIVNTECSMNRLMKFDTRKNVIGNRGITILGKVFLDGNMLGYRVLNAKGNVTDISEKDLITVASRTEVGLINAKVVPGSNAKEHISAIKGSFKRIDKKKFDEMVLNYTKDKASMHKAYLNRLLERYSKTFLRLGKPKILFGDRITKTTKKNLRIMFDEYFFVKYPALKALKGSENLVDLLTVGLVMHLAEQQVDYKIGRSEKSRVGQYQGMHLKPLNASSIGDSSISKELLTVVEKYQGKQEAYKFLFLRNYVLSGKRTVIKQSDINGLDIANINFIRYLLGLYRIRYEYESSKSERPSYNTGNIEYTDVKGVAEFGYTIDKKLVGNIYHSKIYGDRKLAWVFDGIDLELEEEDKLLNIINCFGDVEILRKIDKEMHKSEKNEGYMRCLWFVLAMHNLEMAKFVRDHYAFNEYNDDSFNLDIDKINSEKFTLSEEDRVYYQSGTKFGVVKTMKRSEPWVISEPAGKQRGSRTRYRIVSGLNRIPGGTLAAMSLYLNIDIDLETKLLAQQKAGELLQS